MGFKLPIVYNRRGIAHAEKGEHNQAIADFNKAVELDPSSANYYYNRGLAYAEKGEYDKAIADLEICITLSRDPSLTEEAKGVMEELQAQD